MKKAPRFFCDNCGKEVEHEAKSCVYCGRFFASVRCPACGFAGEEKSFTNGCPSCGYSAPPYPAAAKPSGNNTIPAKPLPLWVYVFSIAAFIGICVVLFLKLRH